jgi:membrane protease YdiL (CAAX protease family)
LYGKLKNRVPAVVAAIVTSLLFGLAHFQWNVAIDVFILSLILCALRSLTGSIWAGVLVHVIKNSLAYYLLFVAPLIGG